MGTPDLRPDIAANPDLAQRDVGSGGDEQQLAGVPKGFRIDNHTDGTIYIAGTVPVTCAKQASTGVEDCSFFASACGQSCTKMNTSQSCCTLCLSPAPSVYAIGPGKSHFVPWNGTTHTKVACTECWCDGESPVPSHVPFQASIAVYADYRCNDGACTPSDAGVLSSAVPVGSATTYSVVFTVPDLDEVVFDVIAQSGLDAAAPNLDGHSDGAADIFFDATGADAPVDLPLPMDTADAPVRADLPVDGFPGAFADVAGGTFATASEATPPDASLANGRGCWPPATRL